METSPDRTRRSGGHARSGPLLRARDVGAGPPLHRAPVAASRQGTRARPGRAGRGPLVAGAAGALVLLLGGVALVLDSEDAGTSASAAGVRPSAAAATPSRTASGAPAQSSAVLAATTADSTPAEARAALEEQLGARAEATLTLLRSSWESDAGAAARATRAVGRSSAGLSAVVTAWWDPALAGRIVAGLDAQSAASRAYATAVASGDAAAADRARAQMGEVGRDLGGMLADVTDGRIAAYVPPQDAAQHRAFVDALESGDTGAAEEAAAWLRGRLVREGTALAAGLSGDGPS